MEKRLLAFLWVSVCVVMAFTMLRQVLIGPPPPPPPRAADENVAADEKPADQADDAVAEQTPPTEPAADDSPEAEPNIATLPAVQHPTQPPQRISLGSLDPDSGYDMLVTLNNAGGTVERVELNSSRYHELDDRSGYLGHLAISDDPDSGVRVDVVGDGTPAALAATDDFAEPGLQGPRYERSTDVATLQTPGDRIVAINDQPITDVDGFWSFMQTTRPADGADDRDTVGRKG